jgi:putative protein-disulfide isomerase
VVLMRRENPAQALAFLAAVQRAFYAGGVDVTRPAALAELASGFGQDAAAFGAELDSESVRQATLSDYATSRGAGVAGFPTLILGPRTDGTYQAVARGFMPPATVIKAIVERLSPAPAPA